MLSVVRLKICFVLTTALLLHSFWVWGQEPQDSTVVQTPADTTTVIRQIPETDIILISDTTVFASTYPVDTSFYTKHSPAKAAIMSAVLPGLGQVYNKKYWKVPIVYAAIGTSVYYFLKFQNNYQKYRRAYIDFNDNNEYTNYWKTIGLPSYYTSNQISQTVSRNKDLYRTWRDWAIVAVVLTYGLNIIDANVDAHLMDYDISDDLSLNISPCFLGNGLYSQKIGLNLRFTF